jgi:hypothetical protein
VRSRRRGRSGISFHTTSELRDDSHAPRCIAYFPVFPLPVRIDRAIRLQPIGYAVTPSNPLTATQLATGSSPSRLTSLSSSGAADVAKSTLRGGCASVAVQSAYVHRRAIRVARYTDNWLR